MPRGPSTRSSPATPLAAAASAKAYASRGRESGARDRHPGPRRHRQHVGVPGARLPAPVPARPPTLRRRRSQPGTACSRTPALREVPDGLPGLPRGGGVPSAAARVAGGQQPAPSAVVDLRRVLGASARVAPVAPRGRVLRALVARGVRRPRHADGLRRHRRRGARQGRRTTAAQPRLPRASDPPPRRRRREAAVPPRPDQRDRPVVPGVQRARRRLRPRVAPHPSASATATSSSSPGTRCGRATRTWPTGASCWLAPTPMSRSTRACRRSPSAWTSPASSSGRCKMINGITREFGEVAFDGARVPAADMIGEPGEGWRIAMTVLSHEREPQELGNASRYAKTVDHLIELARTKGDLDDEQRRDLAWAIVEADMLQRLVSIRLSDRLDGIEHGPEGSIDKLLMTRVEQAVGHAALDDRRERLRRRRFQHAQHLPLQPGPERDGWDRADPEEPHRDPDPRPARPDERLSDGDPCAGRRADAGRGGCPSRRRRCDAGSSSCGWRAASRQRCGGRCRCTTPSACGGWSGR